MRILYVTTIALTMNTFFKPHVQALVEAGHHVDIACNASALALDDLYAQLGCKAYQVDFSRSPLSFHNVKAYKQLKRVVENGDYDIVHCHTPNASVVTRLACRKARKQKELKVFYTAHGFHFYKGAPLWNWLVYYPIEKFCSRFTDTLITINKEDYALAQKKFHAKRTEYVPGVGIDTEKFACAEVDRAEKRREIGVPQDCVLLLSVGELNKNKNHQVIVRAMAKLQNKNVHYAIAGVGNQKEKLWKLAKKLGVEEQVHLLGYRTDTAQLYKTADVFCFPSKREGLPVSLMEAMLCGLPCVVSDIRGSTDLMDDCGGILFDCHHLQSVYDALKKILRADWEKLGAYNQEFIQQFSLCNVLEKMKEVYGKNL